MVCENCGYEFQLNYCSNCGQKNIGRLSFSYFVHIFLGSVFHLHGGKGLFVTLYKLTFSPHKVVYEYLNGKRAKYYNPASLYIIFTGLYFLLLSSDAQDTFLNEHGYFKMFFIIVSLPSMALVTFLFFKTYKLNFGEHLIIALYFYALYHFFYSTILVFNSLFDFSKIGLILILMTFIVSFSYFIQIFKKKVIITILKLILITPISMFLPLVWAALVNEFFS